MRRWAAAVGALCGALAAASAASGCGGARAVAPGPIGNVAPAEEPRPHAERAVPAPQPRVATPPLGVSLVLSIAADGALYVGARRVDDADLDELLMRVAGADPTRQLVLEVDDGVAHGRVVALMQRAKAAGFTRMAIATTHRPLAPMRPTPVAPPSASTSLPPP